MSAKESELAQVYFYLLIGQEGKCYTAGARQFVNDNIQFIDNLIKDGRGVDIVREVQQFNHVLSSDYNAKLWILAHCAKSSDLKTKEAVFSCLPSLCETGEELFTFIHFSEQISKLKGSTGWGRAQRKAISKWYNSKPPKELAATCTQFVSRHGWTHRDVLRLGHVKADKKATAVVLKYLNKGLDEATKEYDSDDSKDVIEVLTYLKAIHALKHTKDEQEAAYLIRKHNFNTEAVPTLLRKVPEIWRTLLPSIPLTKLLTHLRRFAQLGFLSPHSPVLPLILEQLEDTNNLATSNLHPVDVFLCLKKYEELGRSSGTGTKGVIKRRLTTSVIDALHNLFLNSVKHVPATGKRILVAVDVRNPMVHSKVQGCPQLTPALASALVILPLLHVENNLTVAAFSQGDMSVLDLKKDMHLLDITKKMRETPMGPVNCAKPVLWAKQVNKAFDVFLVFTDNQVKVEEVKPCEALYLYRRALNIPHARLITCALSEKHFSLAADDDPGMLDIGGFDNCVPHIITNFIQAPF